MTSIATFLSFYHLFFVIQFIVFGIFWWWRRTSTRYKSFQAKIYRVGERWHVFASSKGLRHPCSWIHFVYFTENANLKTWNVMYEGKRRLTVAVLVHKAFTYCFKRKHDGLRKLTRVSYMNILLDGKAFVMSALMSVTNKRPDGKMSFSLDEKSGIICCALSKNYRNKAELIFSTLVRRKWLTKQEIEVVQLWNDENVKLRRKSCFEVSAHVN